MRLLSVCSFPADLTIHNFLWSVRYHLPVCFGWLCVHIHIDGLLMAKPLSYPPTDSCVKTVLCYSYANHWHRREKRAGQHDLWKGFSFINEMSYNYLLIFGSFITKWVLFSRINDPLNNLFWMRNRRGIGCQFGYWESRLNCNVGKKKSFCNVSKSVFSL